MLLNPFILHSPDSLKEAAGLLGRLKDSRILAGGTFLLNNLKTFKKKGLKTPGHVISLRNIKTLKGIENKKGFLVIKAMTTLTDVYESPLLEGELGVLKDICRNMATNTIRNMATVGGNLTCRYAWTELGAVMVALEARMHFLGKGSKEKVLSAEEFFKNNAKTEGLFTHVSIPHKKGISLSYRRIPKTSPVDVPMLAVCLKTEFVKNKFSHTRVVINDTVSFPQQDTILEDFLDQQTDGERVAEKALNHLDTKIYDATSDDYKKHIFRISIKNAIRDLLNHKR